MEQRKELLTHIQERITAIIFELGDLKDKAKSFEEHELASHSFEALRAQWEKFCQNKMIVKEVRHG